MSSNINNSPTRAISPIISLRCNITSPSAPGSYRQSDPMPPMPNTYMALSIIVTILCCIVGGIIAIVYSSKVSSCYNMGDYAGAQKASKTALGWIIASACVSVIGSILYFFLFLGTAFLQNI